MPNVIIDPGDGRFLKEIEEISGEEITTAHIGTRFKEIPLNIAWIENKKISRLELKFRKIL